MLRSKGEKAFGVFNIILLGITALLFLFPIWFVIKTSLDIAEPCIDMSLLPREFSTVFYRMIIKDKSNWRPLLNSIIITVVGTFSSMVLTTMGAYALSKRDMPGMSQLVIFLVVIPMFIGGGMVPSFILMKSLGWFNTYRVLIVPGMISSMNMIIIRNYFWSIPKSLIEAAKIDGAGELTVFVKIMVPLSKSVISATTLFTGVGYWNQYFQSILYCSEANMRTFPVRIRDLIFRTINTEQAALEKMLAEMDDTLVKGGGQLNPDALGAAMTIISFIPILLVYPFLQKHFAAGMLKGSIKG